MNATNTDEAEMCCDIRLALVSGSCNLQPDHCNSNQCQSQIRGSSQQPNNSQVALVTANDDCCKCIRTCCWSQRHLLGVQTSVGISIVDCVALCWSPVHVLYILCSRNTRCVSWPYKYVRELELQPNSQSSKIILWFNKTLSFVAVRALRKCCGGNELNIGMDVTQSDDYPFLFDDSSPIEIDNTRPRVQQQMKCNDNDSSSISSEQHDTAASSSDVSRTFTIPKH